MKKIEITTDTNSGMLPHEADDIGLFVLPMPFVINGEPKLDGIDLTREDFYAHQKANSVITTSQPSVVEVSEFWREILKNYDEIVHIPTSSHLSAACSTAQNLANDEEFKGKIFVVDNGKISIPLKRAAYDAVALRAKDLSSQEIVDELMARKDDHSLYFSLESMEYLKRGGRVSATTAAVGTLLGIRPVLHLDVGMLTGFKNPRGLAGAKKTMIEAMRNDLETKFREQYESGAVHLLAASNGSPEMVEKWIGEIRNAFPGMEVQYAPLSLGISCHIGPDALGIGCSCVPAALRK